MNNEAILSRTAEWIESQPIIRAAILTGSHADSRNSDELSDYDISLFCNDTDPIAKTDIWLKEIAEVLVSIPEKIVLFETTIPTRLTIFKGGCKVDFSFFSVQFLDELAKRGLPDEFDMGYSVLVDKDHLASSIPLPTYEGFKEKSPSQHQFHDLNKEFWFEVYHVAKYLAREDLWSVQFRMSGIHHRLLLKMICWNEAAKHGWDYSTHKNGKNLQKWVCSKTCKALSGVFPRFDVSEGWSALNNMMELFKRISHETARNLGYPDLPDLEKEMSQFVAQSGIKNDKCKKEP